MVISDNIIVKNYLLMDNCVKFYQERKKNYDQMISDFTHFDVYKIKNTTYYPPLIVLKDEDILFCHVKIDDIMNLRYVKFNFTILSNEICFHDYIGDINNYLINQINKDNGYRFFINNKELKYKNLREVINYYLKQAKTSELFYSVDNVVALTDNFNEILIKYLKKLNPGKNLYIKNHLKSEGNLKILNSVYLSKFGNFVYVIQNCDNLCSEYEKLIPTLENSYDLLKEYFLMNEYLSKKYVNYQTCFIKTKKLKEDLEELYFFQLLRNGFLKKSMGSIVLIIKEFEKNCPDINFSKKINRFKNYIITELKNKKVSTKEFISDTASKLMGEVFGVFIDKSNL